MSNPTATLPPIAAAGASRWTNDRVEELKRLASEGYSASQIAKALGHVTRSGVTGKLHRLGLNARAQPSQPGMRAPISRKAVEGKSRPARRQKTEDEVRADGLRAPAVKRDRYGGNGYNFRTATSAPRPLRNADGQPIVAGEPWVPLTRYDCAFQALEGTEPRSFLERGVRQCRWPIDGAEGEFLACCAPTNGGNYCSTHHALAHPAAAAGKRKPTESELMRSLRRHVA